MNKFRQHVPNFIDSKPCTFEFETIEELLSNETIQRYIPKDKDYSFAMSDNCLMIVTHEGCHWLVVGSIQYPEQVNLPKWTPRYKMIVDGKHVTLENARILSTCVDTALLENGTTVTLVRF